MEEHSCLRLKISLLSLIFSTAAASWWAPALNAGKQNVLTMPSRNVQPGHGENNNNNKTKTTTRQQHHQEDMCNLAMEKRKMGLVSLLPAVYLHTRSSGSRDSPPEMRRTWNCKQVFGENHGETPKPDFC